MKITENMIAIIDKETVRIGKLTIKRVDDLEFVVVKNGIQMYRGNSKEVTSFINSTNNQTTT